MILDDEDIERSIAWATKRAKQLIPKRKGPQPDLAFKITAAAVRKHLEMCGIRWERRPQAQGHKTHDTKGDRDEVP